MTAAQAPQLPRSSLEQVEQAAQAVAAALEGGALRQLVTLLLPVNEKEVNFMSTEPIDYPCSLQKEFDVACALTTSLLQRVAGRSGGAGAAPPSINAKRIDDGGVEGEPCAVLFPEDQSCVAVVYPTADRLKQIQKYAEVQGRPLLLVNPQWNTAGQVVSDFGIGPWRKAAEDFLATFEPSFALKEKRIGSPGTIDAATGMRFASGGVVRLLCCYPGGWQAHAMAADGSSQLLGGSERELGYQELDALIREGRQRKLEIFEIAQRVTYVYAEDPGASAGVSTAEEEAEEAAAAAAACSTRLSDADIEAMDAAALRRKLLALGLPASGKVGKLRERLREAQQQQLVD